MNLTPTAPAPNSILVWFTNELDSKLIPWEFTKCHSNNLCRTNEACSIVLPPSYPAQTPPFSNICTLSNRPDLNIVDNNRSTKLTEALVSSLSLAELMQQTQLKLDALKLNPLTYVAESKRAMKAEITLLRGKVSGLREMGLKMEQCTEDTNRTVREVRYVINSAL